MNHEKYFNDVIETLIWYKFFNHTKNPFTGYRKLYYSLLTMLSSCRNEVNDNVTIKVTRVKENMNQITFALGNRHITMEVTHKTKSMNKPYNGCYRILKVQLTSVSLGRLVTGLNKKELVSVKCNTSLRNIRYSENYNWYKSHHIQPIWYI